MTALYLIFTGPSVTAEASSLCRDEEGGETIQGLAYYSNGNSRQKGLYFSHRREY
jgi:hypothetical protein